MNEELIKEKLDTCKTRIDDHSERIQIQNLCKSIDSLTGVLK